MVESQPLSTVSRRHQRNPQIITIYRAKIGDEKQFQYCFCFFEKTLLGKASLCSAQRNRKVLFEIDMSGRGYNSREPVKVVIISTQYVETDARSFKSVVQKLTGKDSHHAEAAAAARKANFEINAPNDQVSAGGGGGGSSFLTRDVSFKEFDRLLREMPPIHELWSSDY